MCGSSTKAIKESEKKTAEDGITVEILETRSVKQKEALAEFLDERRKNLQFDEGRTTAAAILLSNETGAQHLDRFRPKACLITVRKLVVYLWLVTLGKIKCESFQTAFVKNSHPLQGSNIILMAAEKVKYCEIPLFAAQRRLGKRRSTM